jgi:N-acetylmuramoyl-L-alanine amidase
MQLQAIANDPAQSAAAQQWATDQLVRLARGRKHLATLQKGKTIRKPKLRGIPGYDVGHPIGYVRVKGKRVPKKSLQDPTTFRPEMAAQNRARGAAAHRLGLDPRAYAESDLLEEASIMAREYELEYEFEEDTELDQFLDSVWGWFSPSSTSKTVAVIPRSGWGARAPKCSQALRVPVGYAFIHHTAGSTPTSESQERATMQQIQRYHQDTRGWCDIAYNFLIMPSGRVYEGRGWTRVNGATKGYNSNSLAFCFAGNFETATPTAAAISACRALLAQGVRDGYLTSGFTLRGHRDVGSTACPGRNLYARLPDLYP